MISSKQFWTNTWLQKIRTLGNRVWDRKKIEIESDKKRRRQKIIPYHSKPKADLNWKQNGSTFWCVKMTFCVGSSEASQVVLVVKNPPANAGNKYVGSISGSGRSPGEGHGNPLQYSCLGNPMDRGAWWATVHGVTKSQTWLKQLGMHVQRTIRGGCSVHIHKTSTRLRAVPWLRCKLPFPNYKCKQEICYPICH